MWEYTHYDELYHYGVPGMRWGRRKTRKWATSKNQPTSAKSSFLSGVYAATGSKKVGRALDKSNDRDAENWKLAKQRYKEQSNVKTKSRNGKKAALASLAVVGSLAVAGTAVAAYKSRGRSAVDTSMAGITQIPINRIEIQTVKIPRIDL